MRSALLCIYHLSYSWTPRVRSASECMVNACMAVASSVYSLGGGVRVGGPLQESRERSAVECPAGSPNGPGSGTGPRTGVPPPARPPSARRASRCSLEPSSLDALRPSGGERRDPTERPRGAARRTVPPLTAAGHAGHAPRAGPAAATRDRARAGPGLLPDPVEFRFSDSVE